MAGMISQAQGQPPAQEQTMAQKPQNEAANGQIDSKEAYNVAAGQMLNFVYDEAGMKTFMGMAEASGNPSEAMSRLLARLLVTTEQSARMSGQKLPPDVLFASGMEVAAALSEIAQKNGLLDESNEAEATEAAFFDAIAMFGKEASEEALTEDDRQAYVAMIDQLEAMAEQSGQQPAQQQAQQQSQQPPQRGRV